jgi:hypothetical protein
MGAVALAMPMQDERKSRRLPLTGGFEYEHSNGEHGKASWRSISKDGACMQIGHFVRPGRTMRAFYHGLNLNLRVVWCRPAGSEDWFVAGVQVVNGGPELALMTLMAAARRLASRGKLN